MLQECGSVGLSLIIWLLCGVFSTLGALCYAELGTCIPKSGGKATFVFQSLSFLGDYAYIREAFGSLPAFLFLWIALIIVNPTSDAIMALTFANYVLKPAYPNCEIPQLVVRFLAAVVICALIANCVCIFASFAVALTFINCYKVKWATRVTDVFSVMKVGALAIVIVVGIINIVMGEHFESKRNKNYLYR